MKLENIKEIAAKHGISASRLKKTELVRTIQVAEGNDPCFATGQAMTCGQAACSWKGDCR